MQEETTSKEGINVVSAFTTMFTSTFTIIGLVFGSFGMATTTMKNFAQDLGMSSTLTNLVASSILLIIITIIIFVVISSVSKGRL